MPTDLGQLSDNQILQAIQGGGSPSVSDLSDDQLRAALSDQSSLAPGSRRLPISQVIANLRTPGPEEHGATWQDINNWGNQSADVVTTDINDTLKSLLPTVTHKNRAQMRQEYADYNARLAKGIPPPTASQVGTMIGMPESGGMFRDWATAAGYAAGGQPGMAHKLTQQTNENVGQGFLQHPFSNTLNAEMLAAPFVAKGLLRAPVRGEPLITPTEVAPPPDVVPPPETAIPPIETAQPAIPARRPGGRQAPALTFPTPEATSAVPVEAPGAGGERLPLLPESELHGPPAEEPPAEEAANIPQPPADGPRTPGELADVTLGALKPGQAIHPDQIVEETGLTAAQVSTGLTLNELQGRVQRVSGGRYQPAGEEPLGTVPANAAAKRALARKAASDAVAAPEPEQAAGAEGLPLLPDAELHPEPALDTATQNVSSGGRLVADFPTDELHVDPDRFQYKLNKGMGGQTGSLTGVKAWNPNLAGIVQVWKDPADGNVYVVNGHNRLALANRLGQPSVDVRFIEADNAAEARKIGALTNIAEGQGTALDAAKFFRDSGLPADQLQGGLEAQGINLSGRVARQGLALARLAPNLFSSVVQGNLPLERAVIIGEKLPDPTDQFALVSMIDKAAKKGKSITNDVVSELADQVNAAPRETQTTASLFGDDEQTQNLALQRAEVAAYLRGQMSRDSRVFGSAARNKTSLERGNNQIDAQDSARLAQQNAAGVELFDRLKNTSGPISDIINTSARRLARGENPNVVKSEAADQLQNALGDIIRPPSSAEGGAGRGAAGGPGVGAGEPGVGGRPDAAGGTGGQNALALEPGTSAPGPGESGGREGAPAESPAERGGLEDLHPGQAKNLFGFHLDDSVGMMGGAAVSNLVQAGLSAAGSHIVGAMDAAGAVAREAVSFAKNGRYRASYGFDKGVGDLMNKTAASYEASMAYAELSRRFVRDGLTSDQWDMLGRYYLDQRAQGLDMQGRAGHNVPYLTPTERLHVASDPAIQAAIQRYESMPGAYILQARLFTEPRMPTAPTPQGHFASLIPKDTQPGVARPGGSLASQQRLKATRFAQPASGTAQDYESDLGKNLQVTIPEVVLKANQRELYKGILAARDSAGNKLGFTNALGQKLPNKITWEGKEYNASQPVEIGRRVYKTASGQTVNQPILMVVPREMYADLADVTTKPSEVAGFHKFIQGAGGLMTAMSLTTPLELLNHTNRVLSLAKAIPGMATAPVLGRAQAFLKLVNMDMSDPANVAALQRIMEANAGSARPFAKAETGFGANPLSRYNHGILFGLPEGKGFGQLVGHLEKPAGGKIAMPTSNFGLDLRVRVAAERIRAEIEGNTDPQRVRQFANQFGQYVSKPDPFVDFMRHLHPYAATSLPMRVTELRQLVGDTGLKGITPGMQMLYATRSLAYGAIGTAMGLSVVNRLLSGHWPWENDQGHEFDLQVGHDSDGSPIYVPFNYIAPAISRPLRMMGVPDMVADRGDLAGDNGIEKFDSVSGDIGRGAVNTALQETNSPISQAALIAGTGRAPYYTRGHDFLRVAPTAGDGQSQTFMNLLAGLSSASPVNPRFLGTQSEGSNPVQKPYLRQLARAGFLRK